MFDASGLDWTPNRDRNVYVTYSEMSPALKDAIVTRLRILRNDLGTILVYNNAPFLLNKTHEPESIHFDKRLCR